MPTKTKSNSESGHITKKNTRDGILALLSSLIHAQAVAWSSGEEPHNLKRLDILAMQNPHCSIAF